MNNIKLIIPVLFLIIFSACTSDDNCGFRPDTSNSMTKVSVKRLDKALNDLNNEEDILGFLSENETFTNIVMEGRRIGLREVSKMFVPMMDNKGIDTIKMEVDKTFGQLQELEADFDDAFTLLNHYYPDDIDQVTIYPFISGLRRDMYVTDELDEVYVGLDYFLGDDATYRPNNYTYINKRFKPASILPMTMNNISRKYNQVDFKDNTLLSQMIYFGKAYYFSKRMLPCVADSLIIGYDPVEWEGSEMHIKTIWGVFIKRELLYKTSHMEVMRYIEEAPSTPAVSNKCPGRIGQYLGWKIVNKYMENNPDVTLQELMSETDAKKIFNKSRFKPEL